MDKINFRSLGKLQASLGQVCKLFEFGRIKYPDRHWDQHANDEDLRKFLEARTGSLTRHALLAFEDIASVDSESGAHHLAAVAWNALVLLELQLRSVPPTPSDNPRAEFGRNLIPVPDVDIQYPTSLEESDADLYPIQLIDDPDDRQLVLSFDGGGQHIWIPRELYADLANNLREQLVIMRDNRYGSQEECFVFVDKKR